MTSITVIDDKARQVKADVTDDGQILLSAADFAIAVGWEAKPQGLCQGDECVPYSLGAEVRVGDKIDLLTSMERLGRPVAVTPENDIVAVGQRAQLRQSVVAESQAAPFELPDINGKPTKLSDFAGNKKLLVAFASW